MEVICADMSINEIIRTYPETIAVFRHYGFNNFSDNEVIDKLGPFLKLQTLLKHSNISETVFIEDCINIIQKCSPITTESKCDLHTKKPTLLALLPCGLKVSLDMALQTFHKDMSGTDNSFDYLAEGNVNHELSYYPYIDSVESIDELPDIILSADLNAFFHRPFISRFVQNNTFQSLNTGMNSTLNDIGFADPHGNFTMFCTNVLVIVHVKDTQDPLIAPQSWQDLLKPEYYKSVVMRGQDSFFCSGVLVPFYKLYGSENLQKLASSVASGMHPSQMVKMIDSQSQQIPPMYIMPWFFANRIKRKERINIIFPSEGAFLSPVQMLVKKNRKQNIDNLLSLLMGSTLHQHCTDNFFPSTHPDIKHNLPEKSRLYWIGWDFIYDNDLGQIKKTIGEQFTSEFLRTGQKTCV